MRIAFMGTPEFAVPTLDALVAAGHEVVAAYSQPPRPAGRGKALRPSPVQQRAEALGIEVRTPRSLKDPEVQAAFAALDLDAAVVAAYGLILPAPILAAPRLGCFNVHASLLPEWRGAAPIHRAIMDGQAWTGVTIMLMDSGLDTGPMLARQSIEINGMTGGELSRTLAVAGAELLVEVLRDLDSFPPVPQPGEGASYAPKIDKSETRIDFSRPAEVIARQIQALAPAPGAWFEWKGERIRVLDAEYFDQAAEPLPSSVPGTVFYWFGDRFAIVCNPGFLVPFQVQRAGRSEMSIAELLRGFPIPPGSRLT